MNQELRTQVLERDNYTCKICSRSDRALHVHHRIPQSVCPDDSLDNLMTVCKEDCHDMADSWAFEFIPNDMVKNIRIHDQTYQYLAKNVRHPESMAQTLDRLLGLKEEGHKK